MLSKVTVTNKDEKQGTPKRIRSPEVNNNNDQDRPSKQVKLPGVEAESYVKNPKGSSEEVSVPTIQDQSYRDVAMKSLALKVCIGHNGIGVPKVKSKVIVLQQSEMALSMPQGPKMVRTEVCITSRKEKSKILDYFTQLNKNLNTEHWRISNFRFKGANKTIIFMRMDEVSYEQIKNQDSRINWILEQVNVDIERTRSKPNKSSAASQASIAGSSGNSLKGKPKMANNKPSSPSSMEVMEMEPARSGLSRKEGSVRGGRSNRK